MRRATIIIFSNSVFSIFLYPKLVEMLKTGLSLLLLAALCPFILSDHTEVCDLDGSRCYYEPALDSGTKKVLAVEIKSTTVDVTVFPCYGEFTW